MRALLEIVFPKLGKDRRYASIQVKSKEGSFPGLARQHQIRPGRGLFRQQYDGAGDDPDNDVSESASGSKPRPQYGDMDEDLSERSPLGGPHHHDEVHSPMRVSGSSYRPRHGDGTDNGNRQSQFHQREHPKVRMTTTTINGADDADDAMTGAPRELERMAATKTRSAMIKTSSSTAIKIGNLEVYDEDKNTYDEVVRNGGGERTSKPAGTSKVATDAGVKSMPAPSRRVKIERSSLEHAHEIPEVARTAFQEFMLAYTSVGPGGAFADRKQEQRGSRKSLGRVDVLSWKL